METWPLPLRTSPSGRRLEGRRVGRERQGVPLVLGHFSWPQFIICEVGPKPQANREAPESVRTGQWKAEPWRVPLRGREGRARSQQKWVCGRGPRRRAVSIRGAGALGSCRVHPAFPWMCGERAQEGGSLLRWWPRCRRPASWCPSHIPLQPPPPLVLQSPDFPPGC